MKPPPHPTPHPASTEPLLGLNPTILIAVVAVLCVLGGVVFAVIRMQLTRRSQAQVPRWAHGAYAIWTGGEDCGTWARERARQALADWYGVNSSSEFWDLIRGLRQGQTGSPAWDKVRALDLLRIGTAAGIIDADACWKESAAIGTELQAQHRSWPELAQAFEAGMQTWQRGRGMNDPEQLGRVQRNLPKLQSEIWPAIAFDTKLAHDD